MRNKKISALLLAAAMLTSFAVPVHAASDSAELLTGNTISDNFLAAAKKVARKTITAMSKNAQQTAVTFSEEKFVEVDGGEAKLIDGNFISRDTWSDWGNANVAHEMVIDLGCEQTVEGVMMWILTKKANGNSSVGCNVDDVYTEEQKELSVSNVVASYSVNGIDYTEFYNGVPTASEDNCIFYNMNGTEVDRVSHGINLALSAPAAAKYIKLVCTENGYNMGVSEVAVYGDSAEATRDPQTLYSISGYAVSSDLVSELNQYNIRVENSQNGKVNVNAKAEVIATSTTENMATATPTSEDEVYEGLFSRTDKNTKPQLAWYTNAGSTRYMVIDLKAKQSVKLLGLYYAGKGEWESGNITSFVLEKGDSAEGPWSKVIEDNNQESEAIYTTGSEETNNLSQFFLKMIELDNAVETRYLRVKLVYNNNVALNRMIVLSDESEMPWTPSYGDELTLISDNVSLPDTNTVPYLDGVTLSGNKTGAKYKWDVAMSDETNRDEDGYVTGGTENTAPDLQDGVWGDGNTTCNTDFWNTQAVATWDLGTTAALDRIDVVTYSGGNEDTHCMDYAKIEVSTDGEKWTTVIDKLSGGMNIAKETSVTTGETSKYTSIAIFDLGGVKARYVEVTMKAEQYQLEVGEMYIYGKVAASATKPVITDEDGEDFADTENSYQSAIDLVTTTISGGSGILVFAKYVKDEIGAETLDKVWTATGTGEVEIDFTADGAVAPVYENGDIFRAFVFDSMSGISALSDMTEVEVTELGE